jgi:hypothetical protein
MRRAGVVALAFVVALLGAVAVVLFFQSRDKSTVAGTADHPAPGQPYSGEPTLSPALEDAVGLGNVVILHRGARPPKGVEQLTEGAGPELRGDGLAVLTEVEPTLKTELAAVSRTRIQFTERPEELRAFVDYWLGRR